MVPDEQGRHCSACSKTVIDFTNFTDQEIADYFIALNGQGVCGHFKNQQIDRIRIELPETILTTRLARWKKFLVICMLVFGTSIFPFETALSQTIIASTMTEPIKKKSKKKIKKKIIPEINFKELTEVFTTDGFISMRTTGLTYIPIPPSPTILECIRPTSEISDEDKSIIEGKGESPKEKKPEPASKESEFYILPKTQRIRRSRRKKP